jgi:dTDP-4-amino-4,6-dideoxygalactose transaminase
MIPLFKVHVPPNIGAIVQEVFDSGVITEGKYADEFEHQLSKRFTAYTSLVNSGTSALTLAYRMAGVSNGKHVISSPMTCMATNEPIHTMGAKIIWSDIDPTTGNIDPNYISKVLTPETCAIVGVHWAGTPFDVDGIYDVLKKKNRTDVVVIADAAHAMGASYKGKPIGTECDYVCFSFQAIKHLTTIDGGAITSKLQSSDALIKKLRWFGLDRKFIGEKWSQDITHSGYKFHMNNVNAAIGLAQLPYIDKIIDGHRRCGKIYDASINNPRVVPMRQVSYAESAYWIYTVLVDDRNSFKKHLENNGIASDIVHFRNDKYTVFSEFKNVELPGLDEFSSKMINIPCGWWLSTEDIGKVINAIESYRLKCSEQKDLIFESWIVATLNLLEYCTTIQA